MLLVGLIAYGVWWMRASNAALDEATRATRLSDAYEDALQAILETHAITNEIIREPSPNLRRAFDFEVLRAASSLAFIQTNGGPEDQAFVQMLLTEYSPRLEQVRSSLDAAMAGEVSADDRLPDPAVIAEIKELIAGPERERQAAAVAALDHYRSAQRIQSAIVLAVLVFGLPVMGGLLLLIRVFEQRESAANINLARLEQAALTDSLTGLGNHRAYQEVLQREVGAARAENTALSLALIDIDEFKDINDSAGHARGDHILVQLGRLLRETCDSSELLFRIGGDEFAVILPGADEDRARSLMERFRLLSGLTGATVSIGVAQLDNGDDTEILREKADATLYTAKRRGRNAVCTFSGDNTEQKIVAQAKIQALRDLLRDDKIDVAYQPVFDAGQRSVIGYEALARIPEGYPLDGPQEAFDIAERIGHAHDLDLLCIREGLRKAYRLKETQLLFLNISPRTLEYAGFSAPAIANLVEDAGLLPAQVCFEITERSSAPIEVIQRETTALKRCGFKIALDDVGAGNSGLEMMRRLEVDFVKIDRSVLEGARQKGAGRGVLLAIIVFASEAGAFVIAEGIDNPEVLAVIQETNRGPFMVQGIQGFILGTPERLPATQTRLSA